MASTEQFIKALKKPYDRILFSKDVLNPVFGPGLSLEVQPMSGPEEPNKTERKAIQSVSIYGTITLDDGTPVNCYEIALQSSVRIEQSKVTIQRYVRKLLTAGEAALVNFISPIDKRLWRFTLVAKDSDLTEEGVQEKITHAKRYTYLVEANRPNRTLAERLELLSSAKERNLEALIEAFSVEKLSKEFFDEYKHHYQNFVEYLTGKRMVKDKGKWKEKMTREPRAFLKSVFNGKEKDARDFCKKLMGRLVFLYFVQRKGWLGASDTKYTDGDQDFIFHLFKTLGGDDFFYSECLSPLFFNTLNRKRNGDVYTLPNGKTVRIPFLNGGLFDKDKFDDKRLTIPASLFHHEGNPETPYKRGFLDFLNAFNFTVYEDSPDDHTIAVDPEMLGHIFENLLEENKEKGAFYTPKEIVHFMCRESLIEYLTTHLKKEYMVYKEVGDMQVLLFGNESKTGQLKMMEELGDKALNRTDVERIVKEKDIAGLTREQLLRINNLLDSVKICDPAIGSGAFPMGLLQEIFSIKEIIAYELRLDWKPAVVKENIIQNSIYGVDIERGAVDIARLRFWLSLLVDSEKPKPLPNLEYKIVVGNSLVSKFEDEPLEIDWEIKDGSQSNMFGHDDLLKRQKLLKKITETQKAYFHADAQKKRELELQIRNQKIDLLINQLSLMIQTKGVENKPDDNGRKIKERMERYLDTQKWKSMIQTLKKLRANPEQPFNHFDWKLDFPEVLNDQVSDKIGFDVVIGNPPYLESRSPEFSSQIKEDLQNAVKRRQGSDSKYFPKGTDLMMYFFEISCTITKDDSTVVFITQNSWLDTDYGKKFQEFIVKKTFVKAVLDSDYKYFNSKNGPNINTVISIFKGNKCTTDGYITFARFYDNFEIIPFSFRDKENIEKNNYAKISKFEVNDPLLKKYKWGILLSSEECFIRLIEKLEYKGSSIENFESNKLDIGQGLNLSKDYVISKSLIDKFPFIQNALIPFMTNDDGAPFVLTETQNFLINKSLLTNSEVKELNRAGIKVFDPDSTRKTEPLLILPRGVGRHFCTLNEASAFSSSFVDVYGDTKDEVFKLNLWIFFNSSIAWLIREISGRKNLGGGMLKAEATDLKEFPVYYQFGQNQRIKKIYNALRQRHAFSIIDEINTEEHKEIDQIIFDFLEVDYDMRKDLINLLITKVKDRMNKSKT